MVGNISLGCAEPLRVPSPLPFLSRTSHTHAQYFSLFSYAVQLGENYDSIDFGGKSSLLMFACVHNIIGIAWKTDADFVFKIEFLFVLTQIELFFALCFQSIMITLAYHHIRYLHFQFFPLFWSEPKASQFLQRNLFETRTNSS